MDRSLKERILLCQGDFQSLLLAILPLDLFVGNFAQLILHLPLILGSVFLLVKLGQDVLDDLAIDGELPFDLLGKLGIEEVVLEEELD